ncbi:MAG: hypothetical protein AB1690_08790 [Candidatus Zixiibacteriota bacterium]
MECYFGAYRPSEKAALCFSSAENHKMLVCFSIPDAGISFKAPFAGEELHTEYASLLTLLEFIELNQKLFQGKELYIYGTNLDLINQVNMKAVCQYEFTELLKKTLEYKEKYEFSLGWIPKENNPALDSLFD